MVHDTSKIADLQVEAQKMLVTCEHYHHMTTNTTTANTPTLELLTLLHQYESLHTDANDNLKSCIFNITKARKFRSGGASCSEYSANDVREE